MPNNDSGGQNKGDFTDWNPSDPGYQQVMQSVGNSNTFEGALYGDNSSWDSIMQGVTMASQAAMGGAELAPVLGPVLSGAVVGGATSGEQGGDIGKGALIGGISAGVGSGTGYWTGSNLAGGLASGATGNFLSNNNSSNGGGNTMPSNPYYNSSSGGGSNPSGLFSGLGGLAAGIGGAISGQQNSDLNRNAYTSMQNGMNLTPWNVQSPWGGSAGIGQQGGGMNGFNGFASLAGGGGGYFGGSSPTSGVASPSGGPPMSQANGMPGGTSGYNFGINAGALGPTMGGYNAVQNQNLGMAGMAGQGIPAYLQNAFSQAGGATGLGTQATNFAQMAGGNSANLLNSAGANYNSAYNTSLQAQLAALNPAIQQQSNALMNSQFERGQAGTSGGALQTQALQNSFNQANLGAQSNAVNQANALMGTTYGAAGTAGNLAMNMGQFGINAGQTNLANMFGQATAPATISNPYLQNANMAGQGFNATNQNVNTNAQQSMQLMQMQANAQGMQGSNMARLLGNQNFQGSGASQWGNLLNGMNGNNGFSNVLNGIRGSFSGQPGQSGGYNNYMSSMGGKGSYYNMSSGGY